MRVDKFLWCVRLFKTRPLSAQACNAGHVQAEGKPLKPSFTLKEEAILNVQRGTSNFIIKVKAFPLRRLSPVQVKDFIEDLSPIKEVKVSLAPKIKAPKMKIYKDKPDKIDSRSRKKAQELKWGIETPLHSDPFSEA